MSRTLQILIATVALVIFVSPVAAYADGNAIFKSKCAACHGADGAGNTAMGKKLALKPLSADEVQKKSDADLLKIVADGKGKMPGYGKKLTADEVKEMVTVVRAFAKK